MVAIPADLTLANWPAMAGELAGILDGTLATSEHQIRGSAGKRGPTAACSRP